MPHKKLLSLSLSCLLVLAMCFSLCGCTSKQEKLDAIAGELAAIEDTLAQYAGESAVPTPAVNAPEDFEWNGRTRAWFLLPSHVSPDYLVVSNTVSGMLQANGWTYERKELGPQTGTALSLLKAAIASGDVGAVIYTGLTEYLAPFVQQAADEGIIVLCLDPEAPAPIAGSVTVPEDKVGAEAVRLLARWCEETGTLPADGTRLPVAINLYGSADASADRSITLMDEVNNGELFYRSRTGIRYDPDDTIFNAAFLWARDILSEVPQLRLFCCDCPEAAYGVCYYLEQYAADNELDLADFCVVWCGEDGDSTTYLSVARENPSYTAARGYVTWGDDAVTAGSRIALELLGIAHGPELPASLADTFAGTKESGIPVPETFGGWLWGETALCDLTLYGSFAEKDDLLLGTVSTPLTDIVDLKTEE